jgi:UDP-N-acetylglucosamine 2-epimerase
MDGLALTDCRIAHSALKTQFDLVTLVIVERSVRAHLSREVDDGTSLRNILKSLLEVNEQLEVVFLVHPRTRVSNNSVSTLQNRAALVIADSGGIQEEQLT